MDIILKIKLMRNDFAYIKKVLTTKPEKILKLNISEQHKIINQLVTAYEFRLLIIIFSFNMPYLRKMIIEIAKTSPNINFLDKLIKESILDFIKYAISENDRDLLYYIVKYMTSNNIVNEEYIALIINYILIHKIDKTFVKIACMPSFKSAKLEDKLISSNDSTLIYYYIINSSKNSKFLQKYILSEPDFAEFKLIAHNLKDESYQSYMNFKRLTLEAVKNSKISPRYLLIIIMNDRYNKNNDKYIKIIIEKNDIEIIQELMDFIGVKEQGKYISLALQEKNDRMILNLALTTRCIKTKELIDYIIGLISDIKKITLLTNLEGTLLDYTLEKLFLHSKYDFIRILKALIHCNNEAWTKMIDFIYDRDLLCYFNSESINLIVTYHSNLEVKKMHERIRNL